MFKANLRQSDLEQISAYLDGELPAEQARDVAGRIERDPAWAAAAEQFRRLDAVLDGWPTPRLQRDLTSSILASARRRTPRPAWIRWLVPPAVAAAIAAAVTLFGPLVADPEPAQTGPQVSRTVEQIIESVPHQDRFVVENLDIFEDYDVLIQYETLEALAALERQHPDT